jgi:hypothetical protein
LVFGDSQLYPTVPSSSTPQKPQNLRGEECKDLLNCSLGYSLV